MLAGRRCGCRSLVSATRLLRGGYGKKELKITWVFFIGFSIRPAPEGRAGRCCGRCNVLFVSNVGNFFFFFSAWVLCRLTDLIERRVVRYAILGVRLVLEGFPIVQRCGGCPFSVYLRGLSTPSSDGAKMLSYLGPSNLLRLRVPLRLLLLFQISIAPIVSLIFVSTEAIFFV